MIRNRTFDDGLSFRGYYPVIEHWRDGELLTSFSIENGVTNEGKNFALDCLFNGATQSGTWYIGLIDNTNFSALNATDTMASHPTWTEFTGYSQGTRVNWGQAAASAQTVTNGAPATFDFTSGGTIQGIFITNVGTKGATTGKLWSTGSFTSTVPVASSDQLKITYALSCS